MANLTANLKRDASTATGEIYDSAYITGTTTTLVKTGSGLLHAITINKPVATGTIEFDDALTQTNPKGIITTPTNPQPVTLIYDIIFSTGLSITTGTAAQDITVSFL